MALSYWEKTSFTDQIFALIIGSGIVGINAALEVRKKHPNKRIVIIERGSFPSGASTKNAGFACFGSLTELLDDMNKMSKNDVYTLVEKRWKGLQALMEITGKQTIDFQQNGSYELFLKNDETSYDNAVSNLNEINKELRFLFSKDVFTKADDSIQSFGFDQVRHLIKNNYEGQIDTGKMMFTLLQLCKEHSIEIYNGVNVEQFLDLEKPSILTNIGIINSDKCIIATNGLTKDFLPEIDVEPARAQVLITKPIDCLKIKGTFHYDEGYYYFRNINNRVLFGGGRNLDFKGEKTTVMEVSQLIQNELETKINSIILPNTSFEIDYRWSGIMGVGKSKTTIVEKLTDNVIIGVRLGGMGVAIGTLIGQEAAHLID